VQRSSIEVARSGSRLSRMHARHLIATAQSVIVAIVATARTCEVCRRGDRIFLIVEGDFLDDVAIPAAKRFEELATRDAVPLEFIALVKGMGKYATEGRKAWQQTLAAARPRLTQVTIECDSALVRMAASAICLYAGIKVRFIQDSSEFAKVLQDRAS
jgi:hypothetical protein